MLHQGRAEFDTEKRRAIYAKVEELVLQQAPFVGLAEEIPKGIGGIV